MTDNVILLDQRIAFADPLPCDGIERGYEKLKESWALPVRTIFDFDTLSITEGGTYSGPDKLLLNQKYIAFLLRRIPAELLRFGMTGGNEEMVRIFRGEEPVGLLMPMRMPASATQSRRERALKFLAGIPAEILALAESGQREGMEFLALVYETVVDDCPEYEPVYVKCLTLAAENGEAMFQCKLAQLYITGRGVSENVTLAASWFQKAADQNHPSALRLLGFLYCFGLGVTKDETKGLLLLEKAITLGDKMAVKARKFIQDTMPPFKYQDAQEFVLQQISQIESA